MQNVLQSTVLSQYANSPILTSLIQSLNDAIDPGPNIDKFYQYLWDIDTAEGYGLDVWGRIVGIGRNLQVPSSSQTFGFKTGTVPNPYLPFNYGVFRSARQVTTTYALPDLSYRALILIKAFANIARTDIPSLNKLVRSLFVGIGNGQYALPGYVVDGYVTNIDRSRAWVIDNGNMTMTYHFDFPLNAVEIAIVTTTNILPHPTGVAVSVTHL